MNRANRATRRAGRLVAVTGLRRGRNTQRLSDEQERVRPTSPVHRGRRGRFAQWTILLMLAATVGGFAMFVLGDALAAFYSDVIVLARRDLLE